MWNSEYLSTSRVDISSTITWFWQFLLHIEQHSKFGHHDTLHLKHISTTPHPLRTDTMATRTRTKDDNQRMKEKEQESKDMAKCLREEKAKKTEDERRRTATAESDAAEALVYPL